MIRVSSVSSTLAALYRGRLHGLRYCVELLHRVLCLSVAGDCQSADRNHRQPAGAGLEHGDFRVIGLVSILSVRETAQATLRGEELPDVPASVGLPVREYVEAEPGECRAAGYVVGTA